jgi:hypothetical protein
MGEDNRVWNIWNDSGKVSEALTEAEAGDEVRRMNQEEEAGPYYAENAITGRTIEP